jgi:hypothetical protein
MDGPNYLFSDFHAEYFKSLHRQLACDVNSDWIMEPVSDWAKEWSGCGE